MTRAQAYKILQLSPGATEAEIRKQFKSMALKVHPDINPGTDANEQFILLTQAMELLMSPEVPHYYHEINTGNNGRKNRKAETPEEREKRMKEARERYEKQRMRTVYENQAYFNKLTSGPQWMVFKWVFRIAIVLIMALLLDLVMPFHLEKDELIAYSKSNYNGITSDKITRIKLKERGNYYAKIDRGIWMTFYPEITVKETWFLHTPVSFYSTDDFHVHETPVDFHLGSVRLVVCLFLCFPVITWFRRRKDLMYVFLYQFSFWGIGLLELYLLITQDRLAHLLTLGFW